MKKKQFLLASLIVGLTVGMASISYAETRANHSHSNKIKLKSDTSKVVSVYVLIDTNKDLENFNQFINANPKLPFNRVLLAFVRPTFPVYTKDNLARSGILGYFNDGDGKGGEAFKELHQTIQNLQTKNVSVFLSIGGWNYSCNHDVYKEKCGGDSKEFNFDWFPDPLDSAQAETARKSYHNLVDLAHDLGVNGLDWDYEEFWHADTYSSDWDAIERNGPWTAVPDNIKKDPSYNNIISLAGAHHDMSKGDRAGIMNHTVAKMEAILETLINYDDQHYSAHKLQWSAATAAAGGRPIKGFTYGDSKDPVGDNLGIDEVGGIWWGSNLKGSMYELTDKNPQLVNRLSEIGLMTYDVCNGTTQEWSAIKCSVDGTGIGSDGKINDPSKFTLSYQVGAYVHDHLNWLYSVSPRKARFEDLSGGKIIFHPARYELASKLQFGFEVNQPAFPKDAKAQVQLLTSDVDTITKEQKDLGGVIIWQLFSKQNKSVANSATTEYTVSQSCKTFLGDDSRYDCNVKIPEFN